MTQLTFLQMSRPVGAFTIPNSQIFQQNLQSQGTRVIIKSFLTYLCEKINPFSTKQEYIPESELLSKIVLIRVLKYRISSCSFRGNYSFLNFEIQRSQSIRPKVTVHKCAETIQGRKLFKDGNYMRKYGIQQSAGSQSSTTKLVVLSS